MQPQACSVPPATCTTMAPHTSSGFWQIPAVQAGTSLRRPPSHPTCARGVQTPDPPGGQHVVSVGQTLLDSLSLQTLAMHCPAALPSGIPG